MVVKLTQCQVAGARLIQILVATVTHSQLLVINCYESHAKWLGHVRE